jgi:hypothetical protein
MPSTHYECCHALDRMLFLSFFPIVYHRRNSEHLFLISIAASIHVLDYGLRAICSNICFLNERRYSNPCFEQVTRAATKGKGEPTVPRSVL